jgi:hypothetical protein
MIDCDDCHRWFHGECIGISAGAPPPNWLCDQCLVRHKLDKSHSDSQAASQNVEEQSTGVAPVKKPLLLSPKIKKTKKRTNIDVGEDDNNIDLPADYGMNIDQDVAMEDVDASTENIDEALKTNVSKELVLNYLAYHSTHEPSFKYARQFILSQWNYEDDDENNTEYYRAEWEVDSEKMKEITA